MRNRTTHFDDCGCLSDRFQQKISILQEKVKNREQLIFQQNEKISALEKEIERLKENLDAATGKNPCCTIHGKPACSGCAVDLHKLEQENAAFREGLEKIRDQGKDRANSISRDHLQLKLIAKELLSKYPKKEKRSVMGGEK